MKKRNLTAADKESLKVRMFFEKDQTAGNSNQTDLDLFPEIFDDLLEVENQNDLSVVPVGPTSLAQRAERFQSGAESMELVAEGKEIDFAARRNYPFNEPYSGNITE